MKHPDFGVVDGVATTSGVTGRMEKGRFGVRPRKLIIVGECQRQRGRGGYHAGICDS